MYTCVVDPDLKCFQSGGMTFPLGVYPIEPIEPVEGYAMEFEAADGAEDGSELEEWPDRYVFDVVISAERLPSLILQLLGLMPAHVYPILDFIGHDEYREIDPYISYDQIGIDLLLDAIRQFRGFFCEDGMVGFGAMSESPFFYMFVDEHKILTLRVEPTLKDRIERLLEAFDLELCPEPLGVDAVAHEHRSVLILPSERPNALSAEEIVGHLRQEWRLILNVDPEQNLDEEGRELGLTAWRAVIRSGTGDDEPSRYAEILLRASNLAEAEEIAHSGVEELVEQPSDEDWMDMVVLALDRLGEERMLVLAKTLGEAVASRATEKEPGVIHSRWLE